MLKAKGFINLSGGSMGESTFMKVNGQYTVRDKLVVNPEIYKKGANYARTRENAQNFSLASKAGKALRESISSIYSDAHDASVARRLLKDIRRVLKSDDINGRGDKLVKDGDISLLRGFNFNLKARFRAAVNLSYTTECNRESGMLIINIPAFTPISSIKAPLGTTHFKIVSAGVAIDFNTVQMDAKVKFTQSPLLAYDENITGAITAAHEVVCEPQESVFLVLGIHFFKVAGKWIDKLKNGDGNCLAIVDAG